MQISLQFLKEVLALEYCRNEHRTNVARMLSWVRNLKDLWTTGQGSAQSFRVDLQIQAVGQSTSDAQKCC